MDLEKLAATLKEAYPEGVVGERESLLTLLVQKGYPHPQAQELARALEAQGYSAFPRPFAYGPRLSLRPG